MTSVRTGCAGTALRRLGSAADIGPIRPIGGVGAPASARRRRRARPTHADNAHGGCSDSAGFAAV